MGRLFERGFQEGLLLASTYSYCMPGKSGFSFLSGKSKTYLHLEED